jgi:hypothetical protein
MIFAHASLIQEGEAALFYNFSKSMNGYMIAGLLVTDNMEAKLNFTKVWKYFVSEIVRADDIYASIPVGTSNSMFTNYTTYHSTTNGLKIYKVDNYLKKQYSSYEKHLEQAGNNL